MNALGVSAGAFDSLSFGVPVGFYHLAVGTGHGAYARGWGNVRVRRLEGRGGCG
ncbi:hypothetical protein MVI01_41260 [Myxococcus virescens]|uniref:Uncharacterized protein n=1 Tax=Myxococcus virescens TaxID=83456 RepID=A0A511HFL5_9BACT|nr:hypothetical protein MVI01_41260 [Myxococcus virescens]SDF08180.1 hypothetical protein SAMN04488504_11992 [Myxococcus virescens]